MQHIYQFAKQLAQDESGQDLVEYALAACLIGCSAVVSIRSLATHINNAFGTINTGLTSAI